MGGFTLSGQVRSVTHMERTEPQVNPQTGQVTSDPYNYTRIRVLTDDEIYDVKLDHIDGPNKYEGPVPSVGDQVSLDVFVSAWKDRTSGRANIAIRGVRPSRLAVAKAS